MRVRQGKEKQDDVEYKSDKETLRILGLLLKITMDKAHSLPGTNIRLFDDYVKIFVRNGRLRLKS